MKGFIKFIFNILDKFKMLYKYFKFKIKIFSLSLDIIIIKLEYLFIINKFINKFIFFFKYNKILIFLFDLYEIIIEELIDDYKKLKANMKKFKSFHRDMQIIFILFYIFFFLAGIIPFIYYLLFLYFSLKYSVKYIFLIIDHFHENNNIFIKIYYNIENIIKTIFVNINKYYLKIDKFLFRMERRKKLKKRIIELRFEIWEKYVEWAQRYIDKFDNFILIRFPELWYEFEVYLSNLLIRIYIYKARLLKKVKRKRKKLKKKKRYIVNYYFIKKRNFINYLYKISFFFFKIKIFIKDILDYFFFKYKKLIKDIIIYPFSKIKYQIKCRYEKFITIFWWNVIDFLWFKFMVFESLFWHIIYVWYFDNVYLELRAIFRYSFIYHPLLVLLYNLLTRSYFNIIKMWKLGIKWRIKLKIFKIKIFFIYNPRLYLYEILYKILRLLYKKIFVNLVLILKLIFRLIIFSLQKLSLINYLIMKINYFISMRRSYIYFLNKSIISDRNYLNQSYNIYYRFILIRLIIKFILKYIYIIKINLICSKNKMSNLFYNSYNKYL